MSMLTRAATLPPELRNALAELDPAGGEAPTDRPSLQAILGRAETTGADAPTTPDEPVDLVPVLPPPVRRRTRIVLVAAAAVVTAALAVGVPLTLGSGGTDTPAGSVPPALTAVTWLDRAAQSTLDFTASTVRIVEPCSVENRSATVQGQTLLVGRRVGTQSGCVHRSVTSQGLREHLRLQSAMTRLSHIVLSSPRYSVGDHVLTLTAPDGTRVRLAAQPPKASPLPGTSWTLAEIAANGRMHPHPAPVPLHFTTDGHFVAPVLCTISGRFTTSRRTITFEVTELAGLNCRGAHPRWATAGTYIAHVLHGTVSYRVHGRELTLLNRHLGEELIYRRAG